MDHIVIIGNGVAGITAARHIRKLSDFPITVISSESKHFWSRTALMYIYMGHMKYEHTKPYEDWFWEKNRIDLQFGHVESINIGDQSVVLSNGNKVPYDKLIIATGSLPNKFGWPGQDLEGVTGMVSLQDLERIEKFTEGIDRGVIVGGGLIGIELAEMLRSRKIDVTFIVREKEFWSNVLPIQEASMISRHIKEHGVDLRLKTEADRFLSDANGRVKAVLTSEGEEIACQFVGLTAGVHPNIELAAEAGLECERGILVNQFLETSTPGIYAIGDCSQLRNPLTGRRSIEPVWYAGRMMGETLAKTITGTKTAYTPGPWFNSAKFFDIEYQTYGLVASECPEDEHDFYWEHASGRKAVHMRFAKHSHEFRGINTFGIRLRHDLFDQWLRNQADIVQVMDQLEDAWFDPEFFENPMNEIRQAFSSQFSEIQISMNKRRKKILGIF